MCLPILITISLSRRHPPCGSMRLLKKSRIRQIRHHVANGRRAQPFAIRSRQRSRPDRLARRDKSLNESSQDFAFAVPDIRVSRHLQQFFSLVSLSIRAQPGGDTASLSILSNYLRCKSLPFGPKSRSRPDSRNAQNECQACRALHGMSHSSRLSKPRLSFRPKHTLPEREGCTKWKNLLFAHAISSRPEKSRY